MNQRVTPATPGEKIVHQAKAWRRADKDAIAVKTNETRRAEYNARQQLRKAIDEVKEA